MARFSLCKIDGRLSLHDQHSEATPYSIDFSSGNLYQRLFKGGAKELLLKAIKAKPGLKVLDCTAGLGVDGFLMAKAGCLVTQTERSRVLYMLLQDALARAEQHSELAEIRARIDLRCADARLLLGDLDPNQRPDVLYLDPMFPSRSKSAKVKGSMQLLQQFLGADLDVMALVDAAFASQVKRVVIKRPANGAELARKANLSFSAKANRFDVFLF